MNTISRTGIGSAGSTAAFILGACNVPLTWQLWANVIAFLASLPGLLYIGFYLVTEDDIIATATSYQDNGSGHVGSDQSQLEIEAGVAENVKTLEEGFKR